MKQAKRLTRNQKELLSNNKLNAKEWSLMNETDTSLFIINKKYGNVKVVKK